jgi:predicted phosphodiesterase
MPSLAWATDLHLDHAGDEARAALLEALRRSAADAVILTGDISVASRLIADLRAIGAAAARPVYYVLGNHDHYGASIAAVRDGVIALAEEDPRMQWLPPAGVVPLDADTALIGVDGWADGRFGDALATPFVLNDDRLIAEIAAQPGRVGKLAIKRALADADAARLAVLLERSAPMARCLIVATHVPPFVEALPAHGRLSDPRWRPLLTCAATGRVLTAFARAHPDHHLTVLAGHTHAATETRVLPNLVCRVGSARYGSPVVTLVSPGASPW